MEQIKTVGDTNWFVKDRFGLFIHWGLYSLAARHEWVKNREEIPDDEYEKKYFKHFNPDLYNTDIWAQLAKNAGMKYFVITTKHHEGFCLWDSKLTDYKSTNTPIKKDLLKPMVESFRKQDFKVGFYHSLIDWHHPDFIIDSLHSMRNNPQKDQLNKQRNQKKYIEYLHGQVKELLTEFGKVDIMWFDFSYPKTKESPADWIGKDREDWDSQRLLKIIRQYQPQIILNDRLDLNEVEGSWDIKTPEQWQPREMIKFNGVPVVWEACQTFSGSWGYYRDECTWRSVNEILCTLIDCVSKGGNLLLNVGPTARGEFDYRVIDRLDGIGRWMKYHNRSIYGCTQAPQEFTTPENCKLTYNPETKRLYLHILSWPYKSVFLDGDSYINRVEYAQLLNDASEILITKSLESWQNDYGQTKKSLVLNLPIVKPDVEIPVIEIFLKE
jgi:alpha-L-fucosidase